MGCSGVEELERNEAPELKAVDDIPTMKAPHSVMAPSENLSRTYTAMLMAMSQLVTDHIRTAAMIGDPGWGARA